ADMTADQITEMRARYGLDQPFVVQLAKYMSRLVMFDLGYSFRNAAPVFDVLKVRLPTTVLLVVLSVLFSVLIGTFLGVLAARNARKPLDAALSTLALILYAAPVFIVGLVLILIFSVWLNLLPISGLVTIGSQRTGFSYILDVSLHPIM